jgi:hypothetical protein
VAAKDRPKQAFPWDRVTALASGLIALATLGAVGYQAYMMRQQTRAATWPHLSLLRNFNDNTVELAVRNDGIGPARVVAVVVDVAGKPQTNWEGVFAALSIDLDDEADLQISTLNNSVFSQGEFRQILTLADDQPLGEVAGKLRTLKGAICYCSVLNECFIAGDYTATPSPDRCKAILAKPQFEE